MKMLENPYLRGYMRAFSLYPTGRNDDPWEGIRASYHRVGAALWRALLDDIPILEQKTRGTENERAARELGRKIRAEHKRLGI